MMLLLCRLPSRNVKFHLSSARAILHSCKSGNMFIPGNKTEHNLHIMTKRRDTRCANICGHSSVRPIYSSPVSCRSHSSDDISDVDDDDYDEDLTLKEREILEKIKIEVSKRIILKTEDPLDLPHLPDDVLKELDEDSLRVLMKLRNLKGWHMLRYRLTKRRKEIDVDYSETDIFHMDNVSHKRIFGRWTSSSKNHYEVFSHLQGKRFGHPIIFDFSNARPQDPQNISRVCLIKQRYSWYFNKPLHIIYSNMSDSLRRTCEKTYTNWEYFTLDSYVTVTDKSYLDLYPKEDLVFILGPSNDASIPIMTKYNPRYIFVYCVGSLTDERIREMAIEDDIKYAQFPVHFYKGDPMYPRPNLYFDKACWIVYHLHDSRNWEKTLQTFKAKGEENLEKTKLFFPTTLVERTMSKTT